MKTNKNGKKIKNIFISIVSVHIKKSRLKKFFFTLLLTAVIIDFLIFCEWKCWFVAARVFCFSKNVASSLRIALFASCFFYFFNFVFEISVRSLCLSFQNFSIFQWIFGLRGTRHFYFTIRRWFWKESYLFCFRLDNKVDNEPQKEDEPKES